MLTFQDPFYRGTYYLHWENISSFTWDIRGLLLFFVFKNPQSSGHWKNTADDLTLFRLFFQTELGEWTPISVHHSTHPVLSLFQGLRNHNNKTSHYHFPLLIFFKTLVANFLILCKTEIHHELVYVFALAVHIFFLHSRNICQMSVFFVICRLWDWRDMLSLE